MSDFDYIGTGVFRDDIDYNITIKVISENYLNVNAVNFDTGKSFKILHAGFNCFLSNWKNLTWKKYEESL